MKKLVVLLLFATAGCDRPSPPPPPVGRPPAEDPVATRTAVEKQTAEMRALPFLRPVDYRSIARSEFKAFLLKKVREQYTEAEMRSYERSLAALGAIPAGTDLLAAMLSLYDEQVGAFYVPEERALYMFKDLTWSRSLDKMLLAHELTHALQDQNFDLTKLPLKEKHNDDLALATAALLEGDATVLMTRYYAAHADRSRMAEDVGAMLGQQTTKMREAPAFLRECLLFPYTQGQQFAATLYASGGAELLNAAFRQPPTTTEEVLHPDKFLKNRTAPSQPTPPAHSPAGWQPIGNNVLGQFGIRVLLQEGAGAFEAQMAAAGWDGDRYQAYERGTNGPLGVVWATAWDSEEDAGEFAETYTRVARQRGFTATLKRTGKRVVVIQSADNSFFSVAE